MNSKKKTLLISEIILLIISTYWWYTSKGMDAMITCIGLFFSIIITIIFFNNKEDSDSKNESKTKIKQEATGKNSEQYASAGDMTIDKKKTIKK